MKFNHIDAVLFDLDGTLLDSLPAIAASLHYVVTTHLSDRPFLQPDDLMQHVGRPLEEIMADFVSEPERAALLAAAYRTHNRQLLSSMVMFPGVIEVVQSLRDEGKYVGIVTSKGRESTWHSLRAHQLEDVFDVVIAKEDTQRHKPNPEPLQRALEHLQVSRDAAVYVGDSIFDIQSAKACGCGSVGVLWGIHDQATLQQESPDALLRRMDELLPLVGIS